MSIMKVIRANQIGQGNLGGKLSVTSSISRKGKKLTVDLAKQHAEIGKLAYSIGATAAAKRISRNCWKVTLTRVPLSHL